MKKKTVFSLAFAALVILAVYGVWHYSPLRHLIKSSSQPRQMQASGQANQNQPIIIRKKILPAPEKSVSQSDLPQPLVVLKDIAPQKAPEPVDQEKTVADQADEKKMAPVTQTEEVLQASKSAPTEAKPQGVTKKTSMKKQSLALKQKSYHPYSIMLSSVRLPQSARKVVADYQKVGLAPYVVKVEFGSGDVWLRVLEGHYTTRKEALKVKAQHQLSGAIVKKTPYTNLVGTFASEKEMTDTLARLSELGYSPYVLKRAENTFQLLVGAFITKEGAQKQQAELQSKGIQNEVVKR
jgi:hypothetical protein